MSQAATAATHPPATTRRSGGNLGDVLFEWACRGAAVLVAWVLQSKGSPEPIVPLELFGNRTVTSGCVAVAARERGKAARSRPGRSTS